MTEKIRDWLAFSRLQFKKEEFEGAPDTCYLPQYSSVIACEKSFPPQGNAVYAPNFERTAEVRGVIKSFVRPGVQYFELTAQQVRSVLKVGKSPRIHATGKMKRIRNQVVGMGADARVKRALCALTGIAEEQFKDSHQVDAVALAYCVCSRLGIDWR
jgi:Holliday junction resolvasome RuvABC endonuclease subunit